MLKKLKTAGLALGLALSTPVLAAAPGEIDGLVKVKSSRFQAAYVLPGANFAGYTQVLLDPTTAAMQKNYLQSINADTIGLNMMVTKSDVAKIVATAQTQFDQALARAFDKGGFTRVSAASPQAVRITPYLIDIYVNAPDTMSPGMTRSYVADAGQATLVYEIRDSETNTLLAQVADAQETTNMPMQANSVTNLAEFNQLFARWADNTVTGLNLLKKASPIPKTLTPNQKLD
jgi:hypothetical protein